MNPSLDYHALGPTAPAPETALPHAGEASLLEELYHALATRLGVAAPQVQWVDLYAMQPVLRSQANANYDYPLPAVFIQFTSVAWASTGAGTQAAEVGIRLHIECPAEQDAHFLRPGTALEPNAHLRRNEATGTVPAPEAAPDAWAGVNRLRLLASIQAALHGLGSHRFTPLARRAYASSDETAPTHLDYLDYTCAGWEGPAPEGLYGVGETAVDTFTVQ